ncbi:VOC family protein [Gracilibacillus sp. JCM 18860]|uniref:VOC family protein n=1 Tax=Gracilibacillus sp. JCM 18860 TaxID=1306159 RepID=UPI0006D163F0
MKLRLELFVRNIEKSIEFYHNVLGFSLPEDRNKNYLPVRKGDVVLGISEMENLPGCHPLKARRGGQPFGLGVEIVLEVEEVKDIYQKVVTSGHPIETELTSRPWGLDDFRIIDPDGYYLRISSKS